MFFVGFMSAWDETLISVFISHTDTFYYFFLFVLFSYEIAVNIKHEQYLKNKLFLNKLKIKTKTDPPKNCFYIW